MRRLLLVALLLAPLGAGCLESPEAPPPHAGAASPGDAGTLLIVALDRYWVNGTDDPPHPNAYPGPWCPEAAYDRDPPSLHLNRPANASAPDALLIRNFGDEEGAWQHGQYMGHEFGRELVAISGAANESRALWEIRLHRAGRDAAFVSYSNATMDPDAGRLEPGETLRLPLEYPAEGGGHATEIVTLTNLGRVEPTVGLRPCD